MSWHMATRVVTRIRVTAAISAAVAMLLATPLAAQETDPPDRQAFRAARLLDEPQQVLDAMQRVAAEYPDSRYGDRARMAVLETLVRSFPTRTKDIRRQIDVVLKFTPEDDRFGIEDDIAVVLVEAGVLLGRAQQLAESAVDRFVEADFVADAVKEAAAAKQAPPDPVRLRRAYARTRAILLGTLGRVHLAQGRPGPARRAFLEARRLDATVATVADGLGTLALRDGREGEAYDEYLRARLGGALRPEHRADFERLFAARHGGTVAGLDAALDETYRRLFPNPVAVDHAALPAGTSRVPLLEVFTGAGCPPCAAADLAVDAAMERFGTAAVLMYHVHVPRPDPMSNPDTVARSTAYAVTGVPTLLVDGSGRMSGGGPREDAPRTYARLAPLLEKAAATAPDATLTLGVRAEAGQVRVSVEAALAPAARAAIAAGSPNWGLVVRLALAETDLRYSGENGIRFHPMVVRALAEFPMPAATFSGTHTFDVARLTPALQAYLDEYERRNDRFGPMTFAEKKAAINPSQLQVVAFVQRTDDARVLQSAVVRVPAAGTGAPR